MRCFAAVVAMLAMTAGTATAGTFEELLNKAPAGANMVMVVNVEQILASDYAKQHDTAEKLATAFEDREILIPPTAKRFAMAAQVDMATRRTEWEAALMELSVVPDFNEAAKRMNSSVETIGGAKVVGARRAILVDLGPQEAGVLVPPNRQHAARWIKQVKADAGDLPEYLRNASSFSDTAGTDIILAIDLQNVFPVTYIADRVRESELFKSEVDKIASAAEVIATVQGARLGIKIGEKCHAKLVVDFDADPASLGERAKPIMLYAIGGAGLMLEEFEEWKPSIGKRSIAIEGDLTEEGMRRLMSLVSVPTDSVGAVTKKAAAPRPEGTAEKTPISAVAEASRHFYTSIDKQFSSLKLKQRDAKTFGQVAAWVNNAAKRIDRMPTLDVDPELVSYAANVSGQLREMGTALQGIGINSAERSSAIYGGDSYYYGYDGFYYSDSDNDAQRRQVRAEEKAAGARSAREIATQIADESTAMRRKMTEKYKLQF